MSTDDFFKKLDCQSQIKAAIVSKYFSAWANVIYNSKLRQSHGSPFKLGYVDLFCGKGKDDTGYESTPIKIAKSIINQDHYRNTFAMIFNDKNKLFIESLKDSISNIQHFETLKYPPQFSSIPIDKDFTENLKSIQFVPSLFFLDPWGYKGLSRELFKACIKDWGCDFIFF